MNMKRFTSLMASLLLCAMLTTALPHAVPAPASYTENDCIESAVSDQANVSNGISREFSDLQGDSF